LARPFFSADVFDQMKVLEDLLGFGIRFSDFFNIHTKGDSKKKRACQQKNSFMGHYIASIKGQI
jgi:hypothetical protein